MFKTGSKFLFGLAALGAVAAVVYAAFTSGEKVLGMDALLGPLSLGYKGHVGEHVGYSILIGLSACSLFLGIFFAALHDSDPEAAVEARGLEAVPEVPAPRTANYWPVVGAFSAGAVVLGLAIGSAMFAIGMIGLFITTLEWAVRAWSDRATGDPEVNRSIRNRLMVPIETPAAAVLVIAAVVLAVSRILLAVPEIAGYLVFGLVPVVILGVGALVVLKPNLSPSIVAGLLLVGGLALLGGGIAAAIAGERHHSGTSHEEEGGEEGEHGLAPSTGPVAIRVGN